MHDLKYLRVLLVEDEENTRRMLRYILQTIGIKTVFEAQNGTEGLRHFENEQYKIDMVLCDWNMPGMNGLDLLGHIRKASPDIPFIMITANDDVSSIVKAKQAGVSAYLRKPVSPAQLKDKINSIIKI